MKSNKKDEDLIQLIKKLPNITDKRTKEEVLQAISNEQTTKRNKKKNLKLFIPIISSFAIVITLFIIFHNVNEPSNFVTEEDSSTEFEQNISLYEDRESSENIEVDIEEALFNDLNALQLDHTLSFQFSIEAEDDQLSFIFKDGTIVENNQQYEKMIESILLVAKSYGLHTVHFKNIQIKQIGEYDLSEPILVN